MKCPQHMCVQKWPCRSMQVVGDSEELLDMLQVEIQLSFCFGYSKSTDAGNHPNIAKSTLPPPPPSKVASIPTSSTGTPSTISLSLCRSAAPGSSRGDMTPL